MKKMDLPTKRRAAFHKIRSQFPAIPEGQLMGAIINGAIVDLSSTKYRLEAIRYLQGNMIHAEMAGVDADWIRDVLVKYEVLPALLFARR